MSNATQVGNRIKEFRTKSGFTQTNIAEFLEVDQSFISKVEKGERTLTADMVEKLSVLFGIQPKDLIDGTDAQLLTYAFRSSDITPDDMKTICAINRIALNSAFLDAILNGVSVQNGD